MRHGRDMVPCFPCLHVCCVLVSAPRCPARHNGVDRRSYRVSATVFGLQPMIRLPSAGAAIPRRLLTLARDPLQAPDPTSVLALAGPAIQELLMADGALL